MLKAMQSFFISVPQVLNKMTLCENTEYLKCNNYRVFLKTRKGIYYKELLDSREDKFLKMLINNVLCNV